MPSKRHRKFGPPKGQQEDLEALNGRRCGRFPEWWDNVDEAELRAMQARGKALTDHGWGAIDWGEN